MKNKFLLVEILICIVIVALAAALILPRAAKAQPYFTNNGNTGNNLLTGAQVYNQNFPTPLNPGKTLANQYAAGIVAGTITGVSILTNATTTQIYFGTNIYTAPPTVIVTAGTLAGTNVAVAASSITVSNFTLTFGNTNTTAYWTAIGH